MFIMFFCARKKPSLLGFYYPALNNPMTTWLFHHPNGMTCRIMQGDSQEVLSNFEERADLIMSSPPYADAPKSLYDLVSKLKLMPDPV